MEVTFFYMYLMGFIMLTFVYKFDRKLLKPQYTAMAYWILFLIINACFKYYLISDPNGGSYEDTLQLKHIQWIDMVLAGFEEVMFTLPIYYMSRLKKEKIASFILTMSLAALFAYGHLYQGVGFALITFVYMGFIAPKWMRRYGLTNMIVGHSLYDLSMWAIIQLI